MRVTANVPSAFNFEVQRARCGSAGDSVRELSDSHNKGFPLVAHTQHVSQLRKNMNHVNRCFVCCRNMLMYGHGEVKVSVVSHTLLNATFCLVRRMSPEIQPSSRTCYFSPCVCRISLTEALHCLHSGVAPTQKTWSLCILVRHILYAYAKGDVATSIQIVLQEFCEKKMNKCIKS